MYSYRVLFRFYEDIRTQNSKIASPRSQRKRGHTLFSLGGGGTHVFREYLLETVFACSYGAQVQFFFFFKKYQKSRDTVPLKKGNIGIPVLVSQCSIFLEMNNAFNLFVFVNGTKVVYTAYGLLIVSCMVAMLT